MSPLKLTILLHYYASSEDFDPGNPNISMFLNELFNEGLLDESVKDDNIDETYHYLTDKGRAYIDYILATPLPTMKWEIVRE